jgi:hypothetical protein
MEYNFVVWVMAVDGSPAAGYISHQPVGLL